MLLLSSCLCINIAVFVCYIIVKRGGIHYWTVDKARVQATIRNNDGLVEAHFEPINEFVKDLLEPFFAYMPDLDEERIVISVLMTKLANIGQVDHFDWDKFKVDNAEKPGKCWNVQDSVSIIIQLSGE